MKTFIPDTHKLVDRDSYTVGTMRRRSQKKVFTGSEEECIAFMNKCHKYPSIESTVEECDADDISEQKLLWYVEKYTKLIRDELAADSQVFHGQSERYPDLEIFAEQLKESLQEEFAPMESPMEMGWVGSNGLP